MFVLYVFSNLNTISSFPNTFCFPSQLVSQQNKTKATSDHFPHHTHKTQTNHPRSIIASSQKKKHLPDKNQWTLSLNTHTHTYTYSSPNTTKTEGVCFELPPFESFVVDVSAK